MRKTTIGHFWKWFEQHAEEYRDIYANDEKKIGYLLDEINMHLRACHKYLEAVVGVQEDTGEATLIITANGQARGFRQADRLVAKAPALANWKIQALQSPAEPGCLLDVFFPEVCIDPERLWFSVLYDGGPSSPKDIIVYSELYKPGVSALFENAVRLVLYNILGERLFGLYIRKIYIANLSEDPDMDWVMRLRELPAYIKPLLSDSFEITAAGELRERRI